MIFSMKSEMCVCVCVCGVFNDMHLWIYLFKFYPFIFSLSLVISMREAFIGNKHDPSQEAEL